MRFLPATLTILIFVASSPAQTPKWWKGNLHTHSLWSDGDDFPEMIAESYKKRGYHFLTITDHNILHEVEKWIPVTKTRSRDVAYAKYLKRWGTNWVQTKRDEKDQLHVRLKHRGEYLDKLESPGRFLLIQSEEVSARYLTAPVHINAANIRHKIAPLTGTSVLDVIQKNVAAILAQEKETGTPMLPHINHPNFGWAITAEELMRVRGERFFELYNGHPAVHNRGDQTHADTGKMWDIINTRRLTELKLPMMFGLATDDTHNHHVTDQKKSIGFRGWVMVRSKDLSAPALISAMKRGDFYASTGVTLKTLEPTGSSYRIAVEPEPGVSYTIQFIGTLKNHDPANEPIRNAAGEKLRITHRYSEDIGKVLLEVKGPGATYELTGKELYVRAKIISSKEQEFPLQAGDLATAWTQPIQPR